MGKRTKRSYIAILGGVIAVLGVVLSIFIRELGWWNFLSVVGDNVDYTNTWAGAFFGDSDPYFSPEFTYLLPGIISGVGALLCLPGNKFLSFIGSLAVIAGLVVFLFLVQGSWIGDLADLLGKSALWDSGAFSKWRLGFGYFITAGGGILALVGAVTFKN